MEDSETVIQSDDSDDLLRMVEEVVDGSIIKETENGSITASAEQFTGSECETDNMALIW